MNPDQKIDVRGDVERTQRMGFSHAWIVALSVVIALGLCCASVREPYLSQAAQAPSADDLWNNAVQAAAAQSDWIPGLTKLKMEIKDGDGNVESTQEIWLKTTLDEEGKEKIEVVREQATDGKKSSLKATASIEQASSEQTSPSGHAEEGAQKEKVEVQVGSPFSKDMQKWVRTERVEQEKEVLGKKCSGIRYEIKKPDGEVVQGIAWFGREEKLPLSIEYTSSKLPQHADQCRYAIDYEISPEGIWRTKRMIMDASGRFLFWKKAFMTETSFEDYFKRSDPPK